MEVMQITCRECGGIGHTTEFEIIDNNDTMGTLRSKEITCKSCNGKGYTKYAVFSIEEAEAILKHCGLDKE
jgi:RecJ-like exonuclease